jgi:hypothetical protein
MGLILAGGASLLIEGFAPAGRPAPGAQATTSQNTRDAGATAVRIDWKNQAGDGMRSIVEVTGVNPHLLAALKDPAMTTDLWAAILSVRVVGDRAARAADAPPLWGAYRVRGNAITFEPRYPLEPGTRYRAELNLAKLGAAARQLAPATGFPGTQALAAGRVTAEYTPPRKAGGPAAKVVAVYPTPDVLPENLLRFYIHFSAPMSRGEAYRRIKLLGAKGQPVEGAFLELDEELWSGDGTRFTLVFDPGRVKKGLKPREELGPILVAGQTYCLAIDADWPDAAGNPLVGEFRKQFRAGPADESSPAPKTWTVVPPAPESRQALQVRFPEPLDRALLDRLITVQDALGHHVSGHVAVSQGETHWSFTPQGAWQRGEYRLAVATELEDVAGNNLASPFEVDVSRPISGRITTDTVLLPFRVVAAAR